MQSPLNSPPGIQSLFDMVMNGGPIMIPLGLCSVVSVAYVVERSIRLRRGRLYSKSVATRLLEAVKEGGAQRGLAICDDHPQAMTRIIGAGLKRHGQDPAEIEKGVEDAGSREVRRLTAGLRPLVVVGMISPLLGLLGTVWGMIEAFSNIALKDGLGKPELLASGISQALITTAAGLAIAIPTQAVYYFFRSRIDRFVRETEDLYDDVQRAFAASDRAATSIAPAVDVAPTTELAHAHS